MKIRVEQSHYYFKILINGLPHFIMESTEKIIFHAWKDTNTQCFIQFLTSNGIVKLEYDSSEKWLKILKELNSSL